MFPETFVEKQLLAHTRPGDLVFDPFCGRGTTVLESLLRDRVGIGTDINPVAACVASAKSNVPRNEVVQARLDELEALHTSEEDLPYEPDSFFRWCFADRTLGEILFLRGALDWQGDPIDCFIAAVALGVLHGESHKTAMCLSNRMPRTISTKPDYSVRWWKAHDSSPPERSTFAVLRAMTKHRLAGERPSLTGKVCLADARTATDSLSEYKGQVSLVVTSPPYLDTTDYAEDQWLRLWFLQGPDRPSARLHKDDRHTQKDNYWRFLEESWRGSEGLFADRVRVIIRIGGTMLNKIDLFEGLLSSLHRGLSSWSISPLHQGESSQIKRRQTNSFRPGTSPEKYEHDFAFELVRA